jgi:hypothetical protein
MHRVLQALHRASQAPAPRVLKGFNAVVRDHYAQFRRSIGLPPASAGGGMAIDAALRPMM